MLPKPCTHPPVSHSQHRRPSRFLNSTLMKCHASNLRLLARHVPRVLWGQLLALACPALESACLLHFVAEKLAWHRCLVALAKTIQLIWTLNTNQWTAVKVSQQLISALRPKLPTVDAPLVAHRLPRASPKVPERGVQGAPKVSRGGCLRTSHRLAVTSLQNPMVSSSASDLIDNC